MNKVYLVVVSETLSSQHETIDDALDAIKDALCYESIEDVKLYEAVEKPIKITVE